MWLGNIGLFNFQRKHGRNLKTSVRFVTRSSSTWSKANLLYAYWLSGLLAQHLVQIAALCARSLHLHNLIRASAHALKRSSMKEAEYARAVSIVQRFNVCLNEFPFLLIYNSNNFEREHKSCVHTPHTLCKQHFNSKRKMVHRFTRLCACKTLRRQSKNQTSKPSFAK